MNPDELTASMFDHARDGCPPHDLLCVAYGRDQYTHIFLGSHNRKLSMTPDVRRLMVAQIDRVRALERELGRIIPYLFPHLAKRFKRQRRRDYRKAWKTACQKTGVSGRLRHDRRFGTLFASLSEIAI